MKLSDNNYYLGAELEALIIDFYSPDEFYCSVIEDNDYIKLSDAEDNGDYPMKTEVIKSKKFMLRVGVDNVLCEVVNDIKSDESHCQVILCNTSIKLKVNYQSLRYVNENINNENIIALKVDDFAPIFSHPWSRELANKMKDKLLFKRFIIQFKSNKPDPADGKYPVNLLDITDRKSVTDEFIDNNLAVRYNQYYSEWIDFETKRIFDSKDKSDKKYIISVPMLQTHPSRKSKDNLSPKHRFNAKAEPFTPNSCKNLQNTRGDLSDRNSFSSDIIDGFQNGTIVNELTTIDSARFSSRSSELDNSFLQQFSDSLNVAPRFKQGLDVVSPVSRRKITNNVHAATSSGSAIIFCPEFNTDIVGNIPLPIQNQPKSSSVDHEQNTKNSVVTHVSHSPVYSNQQIALENIPLPIGKYPMQPFAVSPFHFPPPSMQNMYMFQSAILKPSSLANDQYWQRFQQQQQQQQRNPNM